MTFLFNRPRAYIVNFMIDIRMRRDLRSTIDDISVSSMTFYHVRQPYSCLRVNTQYILSIIHLVPNKLVQSHEWIVFCITGVI